MLRILLAAYEFAILNQESISYLNYLFDSCMAWYVESMYSHRVLLLSRVSLTKCWYFRRLCRAFYTFSHHLMVYVSLALPIPVTLLALFASGYSSSDFLYFSYGLYRWIHGRTSLTNFLQNSLFCLTCLTYIAAQYNLISKHVYTKTTRLIPPWGDSRVKSTIKRD